MSEPIRDAETAVRELGALPVPGGNAIPLTPEQRAKIAEQLGDTKPATTGLLLSFGKSVRDRREHDHPTWEDLYCMNLSSYMGERMAPVLRRLLDAEAEAERLGAWAASREARELELLTAMGTIDLRESPEAWALGMTVLSHLDGPSAKSTPEECEPGLLALIGQLRARVAELLDERHTTNEALDDVVRELRANRDRATESPDAPPTQALREEADES